MQIKLPHKIVRLFSNLTIESRRAKGRWVFQHFRERLRNFFLWKGRKPSDDECSFLAARHWLSTAYLTDALPQTVADDFFLGFIS